MNNRSLVTKLSTCVRQQCRFIRTHQRSFASVAPIAKEEQKEIRPLYLDAQATTPLDPRVLDAMLPYSISQYGNPHSRTHFYGWKAEEAVEEAREGVARFNRRKKKHVITTQTEHKCVLDSCRYLEGEGFDVTYLPVQSNGIIDMEMFKESLRPDTSLVSIMMVNNEIGVRQPVEEIGALCRERKIYFHTDAAQAVGKIPVDVNAMNIDLLSISGHKLYGPKGIGALYVRRRPRVRVEPQMSGGGQERGLRSGTLPAPLIVGLGKACEVSIKEMEFDRQHVEHLSSRLINGIMGQIDHVIRNGDAEETYPGCVNLSFSCIEGESLLMALKDIALSSGSACTSASLEPSYVLRALGADDEMAHSSIRFGMGRFTTKEEVDYTVDKCVRNVNRLREMSPLWEMIQEGIDLKSIEWTQH